MTCAVVRSMVSNFPEHTSANYFLHTGSGIQGRPSMGAWVSYGLGSENQNLPGFIVLNGGLIPPGGLDNFNSGFLPAAYQGSVFRAGDPPVANIDRLRSQRRRRSAASSTCCASSTQACADRIGKSDEIESAIANYEMAYRMQTAVPELMDLKGETRGDAASSTASTRRTRRRASSARQCLIARRLVERGVRFIELTCPQRRRATAGTSTAACKQGHENNARAVDQPIAALLKDLKARGLLDDDAGGLGRRVRPDAVRPGQPTAATTTRSASPSGWPAAASRAAWPTARPTSGATRPSRTRSRSTTCTRRCCTCSASITSG